MIAALIISILSILGMIICVFACPVLKIKKFQMQTFWIAPLIGALAGMMWMGILRKNEVEFSFLKFTLYGSIIAIPTLLASLGGLYISFLF